MTADELARAVTHRYARMRRYADRGVARPLEGTTVEFDTTFVRATRHFEFHSIAKHGGAIAYGHDVLRIGELLELGDHLGWREGRPQSLDQAIAIGTGTTFGAAHSIPKLLLPDEISGTALFDREALTLDTGLFEGRRLAIIESRDHRVWIDGDREVVRRVEWPPGRFIDYAVLVSE